MTKKVRNDEDDPDWYNEINACSPGAIGSVTCITEVPKKRRQKIYQRRIGFLVDIDELIEAD